MFATNWSVVNDVIKIQANKCDFKISITIFIGFTALSMLFRCVFPIFYENLHNFWTKNFFKIKFGDLASKYLLFKPKKFEIKILNFGWVIAISLGGCFFWPTLYIGLHNSMLELDNQTRVRQIETQPTSAHRTTTSQHICYLKKCTALGFLKTTIGGI